MRRWGLIAALLLAGSSVAMAAGGDEDFVKQAACGGRAEVELSKLAQTHAQSPTVKKFAARMVQDHSKANRELTSIAAKGDYTLPTAMDDDHQKLYQKLSSLTGDEFDKTYMDAMDKDHGKTVDLFKTEVAHGKDASMKGFALRTLPTIEHHANMADHDMDMLK